MSSSDSTTCCRWGCLTRFLAWRPDARGIEAQAERGAHPAIVSFGPLREGAKGANRKLSKSWPSSSCRGTFSDTRFHAVRITLDVGGLTTVLADPNLRFEPC